MYGYKTNLKILDFRAKDTNTFINEGYELSTFSFSFIQPADDNGKAQGNVQGGILQMSFDGLPTDLLLDWMISPRRYKSGVVTIFGEDERSQQRIVFENATCIDMDISYIKEGRQYFSVQFILSAHRIIIGDSGVENNWQNVK